MSETVKTRRASLIESVDKILDRLKVEVSGGCTSPFMADLQALRRDIASLPDGTDGEQAARKLGQELGSAVSSLLDRNSTVNVYVTINGKA